MSGGDLEIAKYVLTMVAHATKCDQEGCPTCMTMHNVFDVVRSRIFNGCVPAGADRTDMAVSAAQAD